MHVKPIPATPYRDTFPRGALIGAAALVGFTCVAAGLGRITGAGTFSTAPTSPVETLDLRFEDTVDGRVLVRDAQTGRVVDELAANTNHFVRFTVRGLVRTRKREDIGAEPPFRLSRFQDGRLTLEDPATRRRIDLDAFGRSNVGAFSAIMTAAATTR